jgi:hypothetical protein
MRKQPHRSKRRLLPEFGKMDAQAAASIQTQALPEFGKIDAQAKTLSRYFVGLPTQTCLEHDPRKWEAVLR